MKGRPKPLLTQCWTNVISSSLEYDWGCHGGLPGGSHLVAIRVPGGSRIYYHGRWHRNCRETITAFSCLRQAATKPYPAREARDPGINRDSARATRLAIGNPDPSNLRLRSYIGQETLPVVTVGAWRRARDSGIHDGDVHQIHSLRGFP